MSGKRVVFRDIAALVAQIAVLSLISEVARLAAALSPLPVPAGAVGLVMLFLMLRAGWIKVAWIERGASLLVRHLGLFLVPFGVGFMAFGDLMSAHGAALLAVLIASTAFGIAATGLTGEIVRNLKPGLRAGQRVMR